MRRLLFLSIAVVGACAFNDISQARADLILDFTGGGARAAGTSVTLGWAFTVDSTVEIGGLGIFDVGSNGLESSSLVRLWTNSQTLLASTTITSGSTVVGSTSSLGNWLFNDIAPITLTPGSYVIGADFTPQLPAVTFATAITDPAITFDGSRLSVPGTTGFPSMTFGDEDSIFGPNLLTVPEPTSVVLYSSGLVAMLGYSAAKRRAKSEYRCQI